MVWGRAACAVMLASLLLAGCEFDLDSHPGGSPTPSPSPSPTPSFVVTADFTTDATWTAGFSDFTPGMEPQVDFESGLRPVPPNVTGTSGFLLAGNNPADDVALYAWRKVENLKPSTRYKIDAQVEFATNAPEGCIGVGGSPGESVTFKAGASDLEPALVMHPTENLLVLNLDKSNQTDSGEDAKAIGHIGSPQAGTCNAPVYARKTLSSHGDGPTVRSDASGALWLILLTDSGYESRTEIYLLNARIELRED
jgi:hypothetical protein